jgi:hypothetical protein
MNKVDLSNDMQTDSTTFVEVFASDINNNNISSCSPYKVVSTGESSKIYFEPSLEFIDSFLDENRIPTKTDENGSHFIIPSLKADFILQRLYHAETFQFNVEVWFSCLENVRVDRLHGTKGTYCPVTPTITCPLRNEDLHLLQQVHMTNGQMNESQKKAMQELSTRIQNKMDSNKFYFVRLSTRSPKDSVILDSEFEKAKPIEQLQKRNELLKVNQAKQAIELLVNSSRAIYDITAFFKYKGKFDAINLILRDWMDDLRHDMEFRCYVSKKRLTCISQYYCYHVFESLQDSQLVQRIRGAICSFHEEIKDMLPYESYVIDILYQENGELVVIECNPFGAHMSSGSGLFNWQNDHDILHGISERVDYPCIRILKSLL